MHRLKACKELGIEPRFEVTRKFENDPLAEKEFVIEVNLRRRQLTTWQKYQLAKELIVIEEEKAKKRMYLGVSQESLNPTQPVVEGETLDIIGAKVGLSAESLRQAKYLEQYAPKEDIDKVAKGENSIKKLYVETKRFKDLEALREKAKHVKAPEGLFDIIVVDPPWNYGTEYDSEGRRCASPYPEMSLEEIKAIKLPMNENCVVWLWTTNAFLHEAFHILESWGLEPKTILTWVKDRLGLGDWLRGKTEHCILAIKGKPVKYLTNQSTVIFGENKGHSKKPDEFYALVDSLFYGRKLDYFGRENREGWEVYGTKELETNS